MHTFLCLPRSALLSARQAVSELYGLGALTYGPDLYTKSILCTAVSGFRTSCYGPAGASVVGSLSCCTFKTRNCAVYADRKAPGNSPGNEPDGKNRQSSQPPRRRRRKVPKARLPGQFEVEEVSPPPTSLGIHFLPPKTHNGDQLSVRDRFVLPCVRVWCFIQSLCSYHETTQTHGHFTYAEIMLTCKLHLLCFPQCKHVHCGVCSHHTRAIVCSPASALELMGARSCTRM